MIQRILLYSNGPTWEEFKYCMEAPEEGCVLSFQLEKERTLSSKVDVKISYFESILTLKGPGLSNFGMARGGDGICLHR